MSAPLKDPTKPPMYFQFEKDMKVDSAQGGRYWQDARTGSWMTDYEYRLLMWRRWEKCVCVLSMRTSRLEDVVMFIE